MSGADALSHALSQMTRIQQKCASHDVACMHACARQHVCQSSYYISDPYFTALQHGKREVVGVMGSKHHTGQTCQGSCR
jgi:hypothetical protein